MVTKRLNSTQDASSIGATEQIIAISSQILLPSSNHGMFKFKLNATQLEQLVQTNALGSLYDK